MSLTALLVWIAVAALSLLLWRIFRNREGTPFGVYPSAPLRREAGTDGAPGPEQLMVEGRKLEAIKALRERLPGLGLKEAKDLADYYEAHGYWPEGMAAHPAPHAPVGADLETLIRSGDMIEAIKRYRDQHPGTSLKEARDAVLALAERVED